MWPLVLAMPREPSGLAQVAVPAQELFVLHIVEVALRDRDAVELSP